MLWLGLDLWLSWVNGNGIAEVAKRAAVSGGVLDDTRAYAMQLGAGLHSGMENLLRGQLSLALSDGLLQLG